MVLAHGFSGSPRCPRCAGSPRGSPGTSRCSRTTPAATAARPARTTLGDREVLDVDAAVARARALGAAPGRHGRLLDGRRGGRAARRAGGRARPARAARRGGGRQRHRRLVDVGDGQPVDAPAAPARRRPRPGGWSPGACCAPGSTPAAGRRRRSRRWSASRPSASRCCSCTATATATSGSSTRGALAQRSGAPLWVEPGFGHAEVAIDPGAARPDRRPRGGAAVGRGLGPGTLRGPGRLAP